MMGDGNYKISAQPGHIRVDRPAGFEIEPSTQPSMLMELAAFCDEAGCHKVLIVGPKTRVNLAVFDVYNLGAQIAKLNLQIAVVESHDASDDDVTFLETVVSNRGGPMRFFASEEEAREWLEIT